jgi:hypothetical protein
MRASEATTNMNITIGIIISIMANIIESTALIIQSGCRMRDR